MKNKVEMIGYYGSDLIHGLSAWTSTSRELSEEKKARVNKMLNSLANDGHHTPFEKSSLHFLITTDIATHIHLLKHRIGVSMNAESARYKEFIEDKFYLPGDWTSSERADLEAHILESYAKYHTRLEELVKRGVPRKRAKESARFYLPYGIQITSDIMFNWRSFAHFQKLRNSSHAQLEIREVAAAMLSQVDSLGVFKLTIDSMRQAGFLP